MSIKPSSPTQEPIDVDALSPVAQPDAIQARRESSEDSMPIMELRQRRGAVKERERSPERRVTRKIKRASPDRKTVKHKKGPSAWAAKPVMKNDMKAKKAVIKEIEHLWGKSFIKHYIPKCHRPLVKRGKQRKRSAYREHETDPKKWLPSVLKAILMIAKLTNNKKWLGQAMNDVVRYRIKHTGNRKPQLVTTDFDVIEDMLVKDWKVDYAFEIRYKHLLVNRKDQEEDDADIDHILQAGSDGESDGEAGNASNSDEEMDDGSDESDSDSHSDIADQAHGGGVSGKYQQASGYTEKGDYHPRHMSQPLPREKKHKSHKKTEIKVEESPTPMMPPPPHQQHGWNGYDGPHMSGYGPPVDQQGRPMPGYGGYGGFHGGYGGGYGGFPGGFGGYGGFPGYGGPPPPKNRRQGSQQPPPYGMFPPHHAMNYMMTPSPSTPDLERRDRGEFPKIKRESPGPTGFDEHDAFVEDFDSPLAGRQEAMAQDVVAAAESDEDSDPEVAALQLELKIKKLKAKKAKLARK